jgi:lipopolysaccharide transport system permease protein
MRAAIDLFRFRDLLWLWTLREIQVRYKQSLLGIGWAVLQPLALTLIFTIVFSRLMRVDTGDIPYPIFSYVALVPWTFFATSLSFGIASLVNNMNLVSKIYFPREILPLASVGAALLDFVIGAAILAGMIIVYRVPVGANAFWVFPLISVQIILSIGVVLFGAALLVFFRDVRFVIPLLIQVWMYASPVIYPVDYVPLRYQTLYFLNPMAGIIDGYRRALLMNQPPQLQALTLSLVISVAMFAVGYWTFKRSEPLFADLI